MCHVMAPFAAIIQSMSSDMAAGEEVTVREYRREVKMPVTDL